MRTSGKRKWRGRLSQRSAGCPGTTIGVDTESLGYATGREMMDRPSCIDLVDEWGLTFALLDDTRTWRERVVHEIVLRDSDHVAATTAYQIRLPLELIHEYEPNARRGDLVRLLLPFTVRSNQLLLNIDFTGVANSPTALLLRRDIAQIQAQYLAHVIDPHNGQPEVQALWEGVAAYTPPAWREHLADAEPNAWRKLKRGSRSAWRNDAFVTYLKAYLGLDITLDHVAKWLRATDLSRNRLVSALGEGEDPESSSENILLAIPFMSFQPSSIEAIDILIDDFGAAVERMDQAALLVLAEYGRRWEVIVETTIPAGQGCSIKLSEQRPWVATPAPVIKPSVGLLGRLRRLVTLPSRLHASSTMQQEIPFGDAMSTHVEIRAADHGVELSSPYISDILDERAGTAVGNAVRETADAVAIYASDTGRPYFARIRIRARIRWGHRLLFLLLILFLLGAGALTIVLPTTADLVNSLALLTLPLTLAGAVMLFREPTSLAERLLRRWRALLGVAMVALWIATLIRLLVNTEVQWVRAVWSLLTNVMEVRS